MHSQNSDIIKLRKLKIQQFYPQTRAYKFQRLKSLTEAILHAEPLELQSLVIQEITDKSKANKPTMVHYTRFSFLEKNLAFLSLYDID